MKKWLSVLIATVMLITILLGGCAGFGAASQDVTKIQSDIEGLGTQVAALSTISAYNIWYDQYYALGNYVFADVATFNAKLGSLVEATGNTASQTAWQGYIAADTALSDVVATLPEDTTTWTEEQYNQWLEASTARYNALGEVGTALFNAIVQQ